MFSGALQMDAGRFEGDRRPPFQVDRDPARGETGVNTTSAFPN